MDKVKVTYDIEGKTYRLLEPEHFYDYLSRQNISTNLQAELIRYLAQNPDKVQLSSYS